MDTVQALFEDLHLLSLTQIFKALRIKDFKLSISVSHEPPWVFGCSKMTETKVRALSSQ